MALPRRAQDRFLVCQGDAYRGCGIIPSLIWNTCLIWPVLQGALMGRKTLPKQIVPLFTAQFDSVNNIASELSLTLNILHCSNAALGLSEIAWYAENIDIFSAPEKKVRLTGCYFSCGGVGL